MSLSPATQLIGVNDNCKLEIAQSSNTILSVCDTLSVYSLGGTGAAIRVYDSGVANYVGFRSPVTLAASTDYYLPTGDGSNGQQLTTDGAGNLSWDGAGGGVSDNFVTADLTLTGTRAHFLDGNILAIQNTGNDSSQVRISSSGTTLGLDLDGNSLFLGSNISTNTHVKVNSAVDAIDLRAKAINIVNTIDSTAPITRFYDGGTTNYISFACQTGLASITDFILPTGDSPSGNALLTDGQGNLSFGNEFGLTQHPWVSMTTEGVVDLTGASPAQTTTLTSSLELSFTGTVPANKYRTYYAEVTPDGNTLTLNVTHDPATGFVQPNHSPFIVAFAITSSGVPRYAGVI
jgi:hypothetical protein